jgi:hypothetical protein
LPTASGRSRRRWPKGCVARPTNPAPLNNLAYLLAKTLASLPAAAAMSRGQVHRPRLGWDPIQAKDKQGAAKT